MRKKFLAMLLAAVLAVSLLPATAWASIWGDDRELPSVEEGLSPIFIWFDDVVFVEQAETLYSTLPTETEITGVNAIKSGTKITVSHLGNDDQSYISISYRAYTRFAEKSINYYNEETEEMETQDFSGKYLCDFFSDAEALLCDREYFDEYDSFTAPSIPDGKGHYWISGRYLPGVRAGEKVPAVLYLSEEESVSFTLPDDGSDTIYELYIDIYYPEIEAGYYETFYIKADNDLYNANYEPASGKCGDDVTWTYADGVMTISGTGPMYNYSKPMYDYDDDYDNSSGPVPWGVYLEENFEAIRTLVIGDGVTSIGSYAFIWSEKLTSVTIPASVTSIGAGAFEYCGSLSNVYYGGSAAQWGEIVTTNELGTEMTLADAGIGSIGMSGVNTHIHYNRFAFSDVPANEWYVPYVQYSVEHGIIKGNDDGTFNPQGHLSRAQTFTILARLAGASDVVDNVEGVSPWYKNAVNWVIENGISDGSRPEEDITREEFADMLYKLSKERTGADASILDTYPDRASLSAEAVEAMTWAVDTGIIKGNADDGRLNPKGTATRAEAVTMLQRYFEAIGA